MSREKASEHQRLTHQVRDSLGEQLILLPNKLRHTRLPRLQLLLDHFQLGVEFGVQPGRINVILCVLLDSHQRLGCLLGLLNHRRLLVLAQCFFLGLDYLFLASRCTLLCCHLDLLFCLRNRLASCSMCLSFKHLCEEPLHLWPHVQAVCPPRRGIDMVNVE